MSFKFLAATAVVVALLGMEAAHSTGAIEAAKAEGRRATRSRRRSARTVIPARSAKPYPTVEKLANSLTPGQTGCLRAGVYQRDVKITQGRQQQRADHDHELSRASAPPSSGAST